MKKRNINLLLIAAITSLSLMLAGCGSPNTNKNTNNSKPGIESSISKNSEIHFINTGNSDSILIKGEKNVLIDGGDNDDEQLIVDYLKKQGVKKVDYLIATHNHADHIGGLDSVVDNLDIGQVLVSNGDATTKTYRDFITSLSDKKLKPSVPLKDAKFDLGNGAYMQIFNTNGGSNTNEESLVTLYVNGQDKFLFTGDAEKETEKEILSLVPDVDVLKVGHHGSRSSTTQQFLDKVNPEFAVITVGKDNRYHHPHRAVMDKLKTKKIEVHRTDECGTVIFESTGSGVKTDCKAGTYTYRDNK